MVWAEVQYMHGLARACFGLAWHGQHLPLGNAQGWAWALGALTGDDQGDVCPCHGLMASDASGFGVKITMPTTPSLHSFGLHSPPPISLSLVNQTSIQGDLLEAGT